MGSRADTRRSQNFPEKPHLCKRPQEGPVALLNPACVGIPAWAVTGAPGTTTSRYEGTRKGGLFDALGTLRPAMEWINQERGGGSDEWGDYWISHGLSHDHVTDRAGSCLARRSIIRPADHVATT